ncbi:MAG: hypothetical protein MUF61_02485 [archaeon]|nr:hypothetical protein [archaeon]
MGKKALLAILIIMMLIVLSESAIFFIRAFSTTQIDDVTPGIPCGEDLLEKSDVFFVIPKFEGRGIGVEDDWCEKMLLSGKKLEMHGVYHVYNELYTLRNESYINEGVIEFNKCFGKKPDGFKAPQLALSSENKRVIGGMGMRNYGYWNQLTHKVYHCNDSGVLPNWMIDLF